MSIISCKETCTPKKKCAWGSGGRTCTWDGWRGTVGKKRVQVLGRRAIADGSHMSKDHSFHFPQIQIREFIFFNQGNT